MTHLCWVPDAAGTPKASWSANNTRLLQGEEILLSDAVFFGVQPPEAGEHGGGATCVDVMHHAVEGFGRSCAWPQQRRKLLKQLLYLWRELGDDGGSLWTPEAIKRSGTCLGEGAARGRVQDLLFGGDY
jgi:hypothetical protein